MERPIAATPTPPDTAADPNAPPRTAWEILRSCEVEPLKEEATPAASTGSTAASATTLDPSTQPTDTPSTATTTTSSVTPPTSDAPSALPPRHEVRELFSPRRPEVWIDKEEQLKALTEVLSPSPILAMDTEFLLHPNYRSSLQILQVASPNVIAAVDYAALQTSPALRPFIALLLQKTLIVHSAKGDMEVLYDVCARLRLTPKVPVDVFDCQIAAAYVGYGSMIGYGKLLEAMYGVELKKSATLTDWSARPLTPTQMDYCMGDVRHLHCMREDLITELTDKGRLGWAEEELRCLSDESLYAPIPPREAWRWVWGAKKLKEHSDQLSVLREVCAVREEVCAQSNMATILFAREDQLYGLAVQMPSSMPELEQVQGLKFLIKRKFGWQLLKAVKRGRELQMEDRADLFHRLPPWPGRPIEGGTVQPPHLTRTLPRLPSLHQPIPPRPPQ